MARNGNEPAHALLRAGFPYVKTIGMIRITPGPIDVALGPDRLLYVLCRGRGLGIFVNTLDDEYPLSRPNIGGGRLVWPACVVLDSEDNLFVPDEALHRINVFDRDGGFIKEWGEHGDGVGQLNRPSGIAFDPDENLYVSDSLNHRVQKFTKDGEPLMSWGCFGDAPGQFNMPWGIHVDEWGGVYVVDWRNDRVQKFTADGELVFEIGGSGSGDGEFNRPSGVAVDGDGDIYVADRENHRVQLFSREGRYVEKFLGESTISTSGIAYLMNNPGPLRQRESTNLEVQKRFKGPVSVRVDGDGRMYVPDYGWSRVQVYQKESYRLGPDQIAAPLRSPNMFTQ